MDGIAIPTALKDKPAVEVTAGAPASDQLKIKDVVVGDGAEASPTSKVTVNYVGVSQVNGKEFDSSWKRGEPTTFGLNQVISGWTQGMTGMKVGGRRELVIPPQLAYGAQGTPGGPIGPNETLVFVVDLLAVNG